VWKFEDHNWLIRNPNQRMLYVPKTQVMQFMDLVERESLKRINKYRDYAQAMKSKFDDYEEQSEKYYQSLLDKFKAQARDALNKRVRQI
jgi:thymidylate kinase